MRARWLCCVIVVAGCGKKQQPPPAEVKVADAAAAAPPVDAPAPDAPELDAAEAAAGTTGIEVIAFEGLEPDQLGSQAQMWLGWIESHFTKCEIDGTRDPVITTATIGFNGDDIKFDLPQVPAGLADCIVQNIRTPYLGYEPTPPKSLGTTLIKVKIKIGPKAAPPPADDGPVKHVASQIQGARDKQALSAWLDANVVPLLKPCLADTPVVQDLWKIAFAVDAAGAMTGAAAPGDDHVAACAQKALDGLTAPASNPAKVELVFAVSP